MASSGDAVGAGLADADQDAGGERDGQLADRLQGGQPPRRRLVRRPQVGVEIGVERLDHHPLGRGHGAQPSQLVREEHPPTLAWGNSPISSTTRAAMAARYSTVEA